MSTVNHDPWNQSGSVVLFFTKRTIIFIQQLVDELLDLFSIEVRWVLSLPEEVGCWVLELFHLIQKYIKNDRY